MRLSFISDAGLVNSNYRLYQPMMALAQRGHSAVYNASGAPRFRLSTLLASDAVLIHRFADIAMVETVERLRAARVGVVWDNDDDLTAVPKSNPLYSLYSGPRGRAIGAGIRRMLRLAHIVTTPSVTLAEKFRAAGARDVRVLENYLPAEFGRVSLMNHDGVVIAWLAGLEHQLDYQELRLRETFERLLDAYADLRIVSMGLGLGLRSDRYEHIKLVDFLDLARTLARCDIGIAPLADIPWNQARSNIKLKEYASAGLAWLASPVGAYRPLGEKEGGRLVGDEQWHEALDRLIEDSRQRRKLAKRAQKWARTQIIDRHVGLWDAALKDAADRARTNDVRTA